MKIYPLRTFDHRVLLIRIAVATAALAVAIGLMSYFAGKARLADEVADLRRRGVSSLIEKVRSNMEFRQNDAETSLREVLGRGEPPVVYRAGRFATWNHR